MSEPEEAWALRVLQRRQDEQASCAFPHLLKPWWVQGGTVVNGRTYDLGPVHGPKLPWVAIRERAAERKALAQTRRAQGHILADIAAEIGVSITTVRGYLAPPQVIRPIPLWRIPRRKRHAESARRRRRDMLAWAERKAA